MSVCRCRACVKQAAQHCLGYGVLKPAGCAALLCVAAQLLLLACVAACPSAVLMVASAELLACVAVLVVAVLMVASAAFCNSCCRLGMKQAVQHCQRTQDE